mgnify:CR=1 FL=1
MNNAFPDQFIDEKLTSGEAFHSNISFALENEAFYSAKIEGAETTLARTQELNNGSKVRPEAQKSEHDFQQKFEEFMQGQKDFHKTILEKRQNELQNLLETNASFRLKVQKLLAEAEKEMIANVMTEMNEAINVAAEERGISIVFDTDGDSVPYMVKGLAVDLTNSVLSILGIEK